MSYFHLPPTARVPREFTDSTRPPRTLGRVRNARTRRRRVFHPEGRRTASHYAKLTTIPRASMSSRTPTSFVTDGSAWIVEAHRIRRDDRLLCCSLLARLLDATAA